jgi:hypothetical protein
MNPEVYALSLIDWQFFVSLTFKSERLTDAVRIKLFFALMRSQAQNFGVHFKQTIWCLRTERGEATGRLHFHALIAGFPNHAPSTASCFSWMRISPVRRGFLRDAQVWGPLRRHALRVDLPRIGRSAANRRETPSGTTRSGVGRPPVGPASALKIAAHTVLCSPPAETSPDGPQMRGNRVIASSEAAAMLPVVTWEAVPSRGPRAERGGHGGIA